MQIKVHTALLALQYFQLRRWQFHNDNFMGLLKEIPAEDKEAFDFDFISLDPREYLQNCAMIGGKKYLLKEKDVDREEVRRKFYM